jgi:hypothetical protein
MDRRGSGFVPRTLCEALHRLSYPGPVCCWKRSENKTRTIVVRFLLGNSPASEFYMPTFRNTLFHLHKQVSTYLPSGFSGLVVSVLDSGTQVRGFNLGWSRRIFQAKKILSTPSFGGEVKPSVPCRKFAACKRSVHLPWKSHAVGKIASAISRPYFPPLLIQVSHVAGRGAPLEMTGETKIGAQRARS